MPSPLVECVPNFSEGRDAATLEALRTALTTVPGVRLLDVQADTSHNRSVFTFVGPPDAAVEAALSAMRVATERIDLTKHRGEHPRMGATDVVPFIPVRDVTMDQCVALARRFGERAAAELLIPIYLYARAAVRPGRERLPDIRKGEVEGLRERIGTDPAAGPGFGPRGVHPPPGGRAWGAGRFLRAVDTRLAAVSRRARASPRGSESWPGWPPSRGGAARGRPPRAWPARWWRWWPASLWAGRPTPQWSGVPRRSSPQRTRCGPSCVAWSTTTPPRTRRSVRPTGFPRTTRPAPGPSTRRSSARRNRRSRWPGGRRAWSPWRARSRRSATRTPARTPRSPPRSPGPPSLARSRTCESTWPACRIRRWEKSCWRKRSDSSETCPHRATSRRACCGTAPPHEHLRYHRFETHPGFAGTSFAARRARHTWNVSRRRMPLRNGPHVTELRS